MLHIFSVKLLAQQRSDPPIQNSRSNQIHKNTMRSQVFRQGLRHTDQRRFTTGVVHGRRHRFYAVDRAHQHNLTSLLKAHHRGRPLARQEGSLHIDVHHSSEARRFHFIPLGHDRHTLALVCGRQTRGHNERIKAAQLLYDALECGDNCIKHAQIQGATECF